MGKFDDKGFLGPNRNRKSDKAPHLTGVLNLSSKTLDGLIDAMENDQEIKVQIAAWRSDDDPKKFKLVIDKPYDGGKSKSAGGSRGRSRDDEDDRPRRSRYDDDEAPRRRRAGDDDEDAPRRSKRRDDDDEAPW